MVLEYGISVYILYGHRLFLWQRGWRTHGNPAIIVHSQQSSIKLSRILKGVHDFPCKEHMRVEKRLCDSRVFFGIRVQNMFNFSFLFDITPKNKRRERSLKKVKDDQSHYDHATMVRSP